MSRRSTQGDSLTRLVNCVRSLKIRGTIVNFLVFICELSIYGNFQVKIHSYSVVSKDRCIARRILHEDDYAAYDDAQSLPGARGDSTCLIGFSTECGWLCLTRMLHMQLRCECWEHVNGEERDEQLVPDTLRNNVEWL